MLPLIPFIAVAVGAIATTEQNHPRTKIQNAIDDARNQKISPQEANHRIAAAHKEFTDLIVASQPEEQPISRTKQPTGGVNARERIIDLYNSGQLTEEQMNWFKENNHKIK